MTLGPILDELRQTGVTLALDGTDSLRVNAPKGALTADLRERLRSHKGALLTWLRESQADDGASLPVCTPDPAAVFEPFPLLDLQLGFYIADDPFMEFHVRPHYYIERDRPGLDIDRFEAAWNRALFRHRHELVTVRPDGQLQTVVDPAPLRVEVIDLRGQALQAVYASLAQTRAHMVRAQLPIDRWPWVDLRVSRWSEGGRECHRVHYNHNNFFSDGFGTTRLLQEVERYLAEPTLTLPDIALSFRDAALALDRLSRSDAGQRARRYWEDRLADLPEAVSLPLLAGVDKRCRSRLQRRESFLDATDWQGFKRNARRAGLTPSSGVFAAYVEVLATWSNRDHFVLSNMMTRRLNLHPDMQNIVGNFASLYPLEVDLRGRASFRDSAQKLQEQVIRDARHLQWGGMQVMQALNQRKASVGTAAVPFVVGSGLAMQGFERSDFSCLETSQVLLDHQFWELAGGQLYYVWDLLEEFFPAGLIDAMATAYSSLLTRLAQGESAWDQSGFSLLPARQTECRRSAAPVDVGADGKTLAVLLGSAARRHPDTLAVSCGVERRSHSDLDADASAIAAALVEAGVAPADRVAVMAERGAAWLSAVHGVLRCGAAYVPVDPALPSLRADMMLADCQARVVLCTKANLHREGPAGVQLLNIDAIIESAHAARALPGLGFGALARPVNTDPASALAYLIYTSGSTGRPKGVMVDHRGALNTVLDINQRFKVGPDDRIFGVSSIGFDLSVYDIFGAAAAGARVAYPQPDQALNPAHWLELLASEAVTVWNSAPPLAALLADMARVQGVLLPHLRLILLSGDWIALDLPAQLRAMAPNARVVSLGGATEASVWSIIHEIDQLDPSWPSIPYGRALCNQQWHVLDRHGNPAPDWVAGELCIGGVGLAQGYWNDAAKTANAFFLHAGTGERLYRTGDLGRYHPDGLIEFLGRRDAQVKIQGHRIELGEVEAALCSHAGVAAAVVVVQRDPAAPARAELAAHIVRRTKHAVDSAMLGAHLASRLPNYMVPRLFNFIEALPLSVNGKVDRAALTALATPAVVEASPLRAPANETEAAIATLWGQVVGRPVVQVGEDFFEIGGQSFEAVRLVGLLQHAFGIRLSLGDIWQHRTIDRQAALIASAASRRANALRSLSDSGAGLPLFLVHPAGGSVLCYRHLARGLSRPVLAFEAQPAVGGDAGKAASVAALAEHYLAALVAQHPSGPVLVGGWSSGGPIAFELAAQLQMAGRELAGIVVFDSPAPAAVPTPTEAQLMRWFFEDLNLPDQALALIAALPDASLGIGAASTRIESVARLLSSSGVLLPAPVDQICEIFRTFDAVVRATTRYRAPVLNVPLLLLRAARATVSEFKAYPDADDPAWGWSRHTRAVVQVERIEATHHTLLDLEHAPACAAHLERWIARLPTRPSLPSQPLTGDFA